MAQLTVGDIPFDEAKEMVNNYIKNVKKDANGVPEDTISVWFPITQIIKIAETLKKEYDDSIKVSSKKQTDGLRIYFARYGDAPLTPEYKNKTTVILISTHQDENNNKIHRDYFTDGIDIEKTKETTEKLVPPMIPENRGILCPPETGCDCCTPIIDIAFCKC